MKLSLSHSLIFCMLAFLCLQPATMQAFDKYGFPTNNPSTVCYGLVLGGVLYFSYNAAFHLKEVVNFQLRREINSWDISDSNDTPAPVQQGDMELMNQDYEISVTTLKGAVGLLALQHIVIPALERNIRN